MAEKYCIAGIDGGGSKTECAIVDQDGRCIGLGQGGPSNINYADLADVLEAFRAAMESALTASGCRPQVVLTGCTHRAASLPEVTALVSQLLGGEVRRYSEGEAALGCAGLFERLGIAHIAGTGSSTFGFGKNGETALMGGWGMLLGDEGGAYDIAMKALRAAVRGMDGRGSQTALLDCACAFFGISCDRESFLRLAATSTRDTIATFAVEVTAAARDGDEAAREIVDSAIQEHARSILAMARKLFFPNDTFPVALHGGVLTEDRIVEEVSRLVNKECPNADVHGPIYSPGLGLALFALHEMR
jgi:N-acetylglucosamine kinase-like BadF-type ATPase